MIILELLQDQITYIDITRTSTFLAMSLHHNNLLILQLYLKVYSASPIFGVEFEAEERVCYCFPVLLNLNHVLRTVVNWQPINSV